MAISWDTLSALPRLRSYADAKKHYDNIKPIRGDAHETRPCGRRDQKWFSIWEDKNYHRDREKPIHIGYGSHEHDKRSKVITFHPGGTVDVHRGTDNRYYYPSASTNERMGTILGAQFRTYQYDTWVYCNYYENGTLTAGWMPLGQYNRDPNSNPNPQPASFTFSPKPANHYHTPVLTMLNYRYPVTHKLNKEHFKEACAPYAHFMQYVRSMTKLAGEDRLPEFSPDTFKEAFGGGEDVVSHRYSVPYLRWGSDREANRDMFFQWATSDDHEDQLRALITLGHNSPGYRPGWDALKATFQEYLIRKHKTGVLDQTEHRGGKLVKDRYRRYLRD